MLFWVFVKNSLQDDTLTRLSGKTSLWESVSNELSCGECPDCRQMHYTTTSRNYQVCKLHINWSCTVTFRQGLFRKMNLRQGKRRMNLRQGKRRMKPWKGENGIC